MEGAKRADVRIVRIESALLVLAPLVPPSSAPITLSYLHPPILSVRKASTKLAAILHRGSGSHLHALGRRRRSQCGPWSEPCGVPPVLPTSLGLTSHRSTRIPTHTHMASMLLLFHSPMVYLFISASQGLEIMFVLNVFIFSFSSSFFWLENYHSLFIPLTFFHCFFIPVFPSFGIFIFLSFASKMVLGPLGLPQGAFSRTFFVSLHFVSCLYRYGYFSVL